MMKKVTLNCIYLLLLKFVYCETNHYKYELTEHLLLKSDFKTFYKLSSVGCVTHCSHTDGCKSVSFKPSDGECRLSDVPSVAIQQDGTTKKEWNTYSRQGKITTYVHFLYICDVILNMIRSL